jgi:chromate transport protein ChrA
MPIWLIALLAYLALALPSAWLLIAALAAGTAPDASTNTSPTVQGLSRSLEPSPVEQV